MCCIIKVPPVWPSPLLATTTPPPSLVPSKWIKMKSWPHVLWRRTRPRNVEARSQPATTGASSWLTAASCVGLSLAGRLEKAQITTVPQYAPGPLERREHRSREGRAGHCLFPGGRHRTRRRRHGRRRLLDASRSCHDEDSRTYCTMYVCAHRPGCALRHSSGAADSASSGPQSTTPPWRPCHPVTTLSPFPSPPLLPWHAAHQIRLLASLGRAGWPWQANRRRARVSAGDETPFEGPTTPMPHSHDAHAVVCRAERTEKPVSETARHGRVGRLLLLHTYMLLIHGHQLHKSCLERQKGCRRGPPPKSSVAS